MAKKLPYHNIKRALANQFPSLDYEHPKYRWWVLWNVMIGTFMAVLDATIVNVALPNLMGQFGTTLDQIQWVMTAYLLTFGVMLPASGWLADNFGYKKMYFLGMLLFTLGSFLCSVSWSENVLIAFRVIQGIGGGLIMPVGMAIVMREFPIEKRGLALGLWGIAAATSISFGPYLGGFLIDKVRWQAIFDINVPIGIFGMLTTLVIQREYISQHKKAFDLIGFITMSIFLLALLVALAEGTAEWNTGGWHSRFILSCFAISFLFFVLFLINEMVVNKAHPFVKLNLMKDFNFTMANFVLFIFGVGIFGSTFILPLYLENSMGYTPLEAGTVFLFPGIVQGVASAISGFLSDKWNPKILSFIGMVILGYSLYLNHYLYLYSSYSQIIMPLYLRGLGMGLLFTPLSKIALSNITADQTAQASGLYNVIRQIGGSFGVAIFITILTNKQILHTSLYGQSVINSPVFDKTKSVVQYFVQQHAGGPTHNIMNQTLALLGTYISNTAFVSSVEDAFLISAILTFIALIPIIFLRISHKKASSSHTSLE
ncbi:MAG: DHA2 family efflux MFS transporter permease subunit [Candidatus Omnitrophica bacterium]|jgi:DHA2 family multidrug resistance protein|nr:DHA2 family efflux MFS transporter permease subunit [Candidatus Omnitrophota bacterium]